MSLQTIYDSLIALVRDNQDYAEPIIFFVGMAESVPVLSVFCPSSVLFLGLGAAHGAAGSPFTHLWIAGALGASFGDCLSYGFGRLFGDRVQHMWPMSQRPEWWAKGHDFFERRGVLGVGFGKFMGPLRPVVPVVAGVLQMPLVPFLCASLVSSFAWAGALLAPGIFGLSWFLE